jgi:hypothetical protein
MPGSRPRRFSDRSRVTLARSVGSGCATPFFETVRGDEACGLGIADGNGRD